jgi:hypothetical protein
MRLSQQQVDLVSFEIVRELLDRELVSGDEARLARAVAHAITEDLKVEAALDVEVHEILKTYEAYMRANQVEYAEMFERIKRKLVQERKLIL